MNKIVIEIDCDDGVVTASQDRMASKLEKFKPVETTKSELITELIVPEIARLMKLTKVELMTASLAAL